MMGIAGCLTYEFQVSLPVMADRGLRVGATGFGFMTAAMGVGAVIGGLFVAARGKTGLRPLVLSALGFGTALAFATIAPNLPLELLALGVAGAGSIAFMSMGNSTLQLNAAPDMRGRVMSLWFVAFQGSTPIGGPLVGVTMAAIGPRAGLGLGALVALLVAFGGALALRRLAVAAARPPRVAPPDRARLTRRAPLELVVDFARRRSTPERTSLSTKEHSHAAHRGHRIHLAGRSQSRIPAEPRASGTAAGRSSSTTPTG